VSEPTREAVVPAARALAGALLLPLALIERDVDQPRRDWRTDWVYDHADDAYKRQGVQYARLEELAESIRAVGLLQPLVVRSHPDRPGRYIIIAGHRRRRAAEMVGLIEVPVVVREAPEAELRALQLIENVQRQDLTPMDEARAYDELMALQGLSAAEVARLVHVSFQHVVTRLRVLHDDILREAVEARQISASVAREITKLSVEAATELRRRVQAGEKLQMSAVVEARSRLAAAGIVNPRRKRPRAEATAREEATSAGLAGADDSIWHLAPWRVAPLAPMTAPAGARCRARRAADPGQDVVAGTPSEPEPARDGEHVVNGSPLNRLEAIPRDSAQVEALVRVLDRQSYDRVVEILDYGVGRGWSCAALLHLIRGTRVARRRSRSVG
jgi:ParB family chromosome partitioning protein